MLEVTENLNTEVLKISCWAVSVYNALIVNRYDKDYKIRER